MNTAGALSTQEEEETTETGGLGQMCTVGYSG